MTMPSDAQGHYVDDDLSARHDGELTDDERSPLDEHVSTCPSCAARLAALAETPPLAPPPVDELARRRMIERALAARADAARPWWQSPRLAAAAAVVAVVGAGSAVLANLGDGGSDVVATAPSGGGGTGGAAGPPQVYRGDLGALDDPSVIRDALESHAGGAVSGGGGTFGAESGEAGELDATDDEAAPSARSELPATPEALVTPGEERQAAGEDDREAARRCLPAVSDALPDDAFLALAATGTFAGNPAVALAFTGTDSGRVLALVVSRDDCSILTAQFF